MQPITILLVPSDGYAWAGLRTALGSASGLTVVAEAHTAAAALDRFADLSPDCIIMAAAIAGGSTQALLARMRERSAASRFVVLADTVDRDDVLGFAAPGGDAYLLWSDLTPGKLRRCLIAIQRDGLVVGSRATVAALSAPSRDRAGAGLDRLTARQQEVLRLLVRGLDDQAIAHALGVSRNTVPAHVHQIEQRAGARNRSELCYLAGRHDMVESAPTTV